MNFRELSKRGFDVFCTIAGLFVLSPAFLIIAGLVWLDSGRPVFYRGVRMGRHGIPFRIFKFRTMILDAASFGGLSTAKDDHRVTRIGRFLRRHKLDELPQLFNVLKGEMSIVGPRPEMPEYVSQYAGEEKLIMMVRPGITDYASIEFRSLGDLLGNEDPDRVYEERIRPIKNALRIKYVKERTLLGDVSIILKTLYKLIGR